MVAKRSEPSALKRGKDFHKEVQSEWKDAFEKRVSRYRGKTNR